MLAEAKKCVLATVVLAFSNTAVAAQTNVLETQPIIEEMAEGGTLLSAASRGDLLTVQKLIKQGVNVNYQDGDLKTALHLAAGQGKAEVAKWLVEEASAKTDLGDYRGRMPLHAAAMGGYLCIVRWFVSNGYADLNQPDHIGHTALYWSAAYGNTEITQWLLNQGADTTELESFVEHYDNINHLLQEHGQRIRDAKQATGNLLISQSSQWKTLLPLLYEYLGWQTTDEQVTTRPTCCCSLSCGIL